MLDRVLRHIVSAQPLLAVEHCAALLTADRDPYVVAVQSVAQFMSRDYEKAARTALSAVAEADDSEARMIALAASGLAAAGWAAPAGSVPKTVDDPLAAALAELHSLDATADPLRTFTFYLLTEAALGCARLDLAQTFAARWGDLPTDFFVSDGKQHPFVSMMHATRQRLLAFRGQITVGDRGRCEHLQAERAVNYGESIEPGAATRDEHGSCGSPGVPGGKKTIGHEKVATRGDVVRRIGFGFLKLVSESSDGCAFCCVAAHQARR